MNRTMKKSKNIALVAHDQRKPDLIEWCVRHKDKLKKHNLCATGTTGKYVSEKTSLKVDQFLSGPLGGDQQIGAMIAEGKIDILIFFWDTLSAMPHDPDVKAILRLASLWNIPIACNKASADFIIESPYFDQEYLQELVQVEKYQASRSK